MKRYPWPEKFGVNRDYIEYPGNPPALMTCWSFAWPHTVSELHSINAKIIDRLVSSAARSPEKSARIIWRTASRHIQIEDGPALRHWSIATSTVGVTNLMHDLEELRNLRQCLGVAEQDIVPHQGDWIFGLSGPDLVPYWNLMPWLVMENGHVSVYGTPMILPAPFCDTIPGRKVVIGYTGGLTWEEPTQETPFPWTRDQWNFARGMALLAAEYPDPFTFDVMAAICEEALGYFPRGVALDLLTFPLFVELIQDGRTALRMAAAH